jgi:hypothetical protein
LRLEVLENEKEEDKNLHPKPINMHCLCTKLRDFRGIRESTESLFV